MLLRVKRPSATKTCPATIPNGRTPPSIQSSPNLHGNGPLSARLPPVGVLEVKPDDVGPDGSIAEKMIWYTAGVFGDLEVQMTRLDRTEPPRLVETVSGSGGSWAARLSFGGEGCWRINGRMGDISLTFVVEVIIR